ncbi:MAG: hypothetical protein EP319_04835 [Deltaproteobacteria bacterium]|nr:MAG: hypothetical protein EP319_04835 [Deltaproteobacteria bacterium]
MKTLVMLSFLFLSFNAFSEDGKKGDGQNFEKAKSMMLENIEKRISNLQDVKSCVSSASDKSALKECRKKMKSMNTEMKGKMKEMRKMKKERKQKRKGSDSDDE